MDESHLRVGAVRPWLRGRRAFLQTAVSAVFAQGAVTACKSSADPPAPWDLDAEPCLPPPDNSFEDALEFEGFRGLADLPEFALDCHGRLCCTLDDLPPVIDIHTHLAFSFLNSPPVDLLQASEGVDYYVGCDGLPDGSSGASVVDLSTYANYCATSEMLAAMDQEILATTVGVEGSAWARTHTIPNLVAEMDRMQIRQAVVLPIALGLEKNDDATNTWMQAISDAAVQDRLIAFGSVHPKDPDKIAKLEGYVARGIRGVKVHPTMQATFPDSPDVMEIYQACERLGMPVLLHTGRAGIEPSFMQKYSLIERLVAPVRDFPKVTFVFAHTGASLDWRAALDLALSSPNVWLDVACPALPTIRTVLEEFDVERVMFGSDWPFYPEALSLAKVLIATRGDRSVRDLVLHGNAKRLLKL